MANLIIKPTSGGSLIFQDEGGTAANTIDASGNTQLAGTLGVTGNATLSGTANNLGTISSATRFPAGVTIKTTVYNIGKGSTSQSGFPNDNTVPQRSEGVEMFSQAYTPSTANCILLIRTYCYLAESSNVADDMGFGLFISDSNDCLQANSSIWGTYSSPYGHDVGLRMIEHSMASWGATAKTFSLRTHKCNAYNYPHLYGNHMGENKFGLAATSKFIVQEIAT